MHSLWKGQQGAMPSNREFKNELQRLCKLRNMVCVNVWMSNGSTELYEEMATLYLKEEGEEKAVRELADWLKGEVGEFPEGLDNTSMMGDLLKSAIGKVDWREIAASYIESAVEQEKESA